MHLTLNRRKSLYLNINRNGATHNCYKLFLALVPVMSNKVHCAHILVKTEKEVNQVLERLKKGESIHSHSQRRIPCVPPKNVAET